MSNPSVERLVRDDWNRQHIVRHDVSPAEADGVVTVDPLVIDSYRNRLILVGQLASGRMLEVVVSPVQAHPGSFYVFTARPASRKERVALVRRAGGPT